MDKQLKWGLTLSLYSTIHTVWAGRQLFDADVWATTCLWKFVEDGLVVKHSSFLFYAAYFTIPYWQFLSHSAMPECNLGIGGMSDGPSACLSLHLSVTYWYWVICSGTLLFSSRVLCLTQVRSTCSWTLPCVWSLVPSVLHLSHGFQCSPTLNCQPYEGRLPLTTWWRKSSNMTANPAWYP